MAPRTATEMADAEIDAFLRERRTGVLSLAKGDVGYGIPVSYTYPDDERAVYLRLGFAPESRKRSFVESSEGVSLVVYDETEAGWKSVVLEGRLSGIAPNRLESSLVEDVRGFHIPYFSVFRHPSSEIDFEIYRLAPSTVTGIAEAT